MRQPIEENGILGRAVASSELLWQTRLFENSVSGMSGFDFAVHRKANLRNWAKEPLIKSVRPEIAEAAVLSLTKRSPLLVTSTVFAFV